jgi:hypothetical protein
MMFDLDGTGVESNVAAGIAELANREKRGMSESRNNVDSEGETGQIVLRLLCGIHYSAIGVVDANGVAGGALVDNMGGNSAEARCTAAVGNSGGVGRTEGGGPRRVGTVVEKQLKPESLITLDVGDGGLTTVASVGSPRHQEQAAVLGTN